MLVIAGARRDFDTRWVAVAGFFSVLVLAML